jgi:hypothetical protein
MEAIKTFENGKIEVNDNIITYKSKNGKHSQEMSRGNIGGINKEHFKVLPADVFQYGFISVALGITCFILGAFAKSDGMMTIGWVFFVFGGFLVLGNLFFDGMLGIKITTQLMMFLVGQKGYKITIQNSSGGNNIEFFISEKEIFNTDELYKYKKEKVNKVVVAQPNSGIDDIAKLAELRDKGIITDAEFDAKKKQILGI